MRRTPSAVLIPMVAVLGTACSDAGTPTSPSPAALNAASLAKLPPPPPAIDGVMSPGEWDGAATFPFRVYVPTTAGAVPATVYVTHDKTYLYLAVTFDRTSPFHPSDIIGFEFDNDNDGIREDGDDIVFESAGVPQNVAGLGGDFFRFGGGAQNQSDGAGGGTNDVLAAWGTLGTVGVFEYRHPLMSGDAGHDFSIDPSGSPVTVGMQTSVQLERDPVGSGLTVNTFYPSFTSYCKLTIGKKTTSVACP
jgi:hypothetical protein